MTEQMAENEEIKTEQKSESEHHHHHHDHHHHHEHGEKDHGRSHKTVSSWKKKYAVKPVRKEAVMIVALLLAVCVSLLLLYRCDQKEPETEVLQSMSEAVKESVSDEALYEKWNMEGEDVTSSPVDTVLYNGKTYKPKEDLTKLLIIGLDVSDLTERFCDMKNRQQADFLLLVGIDDRTKKGWALQINRDTMVDMPVIDVKGRVAGSVYGQICLSHNYGLNETGACENTVKTVENLLYGTGVDHYICTGMDSVKYLNDAVGGVTLSCLDDFPSDPALKAGKEVTLKGDQALTYVRARMEMPDDTNIRRMERQQQYLTVLRKNCIEKSKTDSNFMINTLLALSDNILSDCRVNELSDIANAAVQYDFGEILNIKGDAVDGEEYVEFYADDAELQKQVIELMYEEVH